MSEPFREGLRRLEQEETNSRPSDAALRAFANAVAALRDDAQAKGLDKLTMREVNAYRQEGCAT